MSLLTKDAFFNGALYIRQYRLGYRFSIDAVILAAHVVPREGDTLVDLGCGCGVISLMLAFRNPTIRVYGIEIQKELSDIACRNVSDNALDGRIVILHKDMKSLHPDMIGGPVDWVVSNPPYRYRNSGRVNPNAQKAIARHEISVSLEDVVGGAQRVLKTAGRLVTIYPAERLTDILGGMRCGGIEPKQVRMIHSHRSSGGNLVLVIGIKGANPGVKVMPPLYIYTQKGEYSREVQKMFVS